MGIIDSRSIGTLTLDVRNFLNAHPALINDIAGHAVAHMLYSYIRHSKKRGLSKRQVRKLKNRKRRWFVDNIIMHHKRLHDRNRELAVSKARQRVQARKKALERARVEKFQPKPNKEKEEESMKWRNAVTMKDRGKTLRGRIDTKKSRARTRWTSIAEGNK